MSLPNGDTVDVRMAHLAFPPSGSSYGTMYVYFAGASSEYDLSSGDSPTIYNDLKRFGVEETISSDWAGGVCVPGSVSSWTDEDNLDVVNPDSGSNVGLFKISTWESIYSAILDFYNNVSGEIQSYVQTVFDNYTADNIGEILTGQDIRREFSDDEMGAAVSEYIAMGYAADDVDMGTTVRVSADTSNTEDGVTEEVEGILLADIPDDTLASWEYSINSSTLTINDASLRDEYRSEGDTRAYTVVYDDGSGNEVTEQVAVDSGFAPGDAVALDSATQSTLIRVERDTSNWDGDIATAIAAGTTVTASDYRNARMVYTDSNDKIQRIELGGDIDLLEVVEENRSEVVYTSWVNVTSDPAVSKQEMDELLNTQQKILEELSNNDSGGTVIDFSGLSNLPAWAPGGLIAALVAWYALDDN
jgi:hypothetical protein